MKSAAGPVIPGAGAAAPADEDLLPVARLPTGPWSFLWLFVTRYFAGRYLLMIGTVLVAQASTPSSPIS